MISVKSGTYELIYADGRRVSVSASPRLAAIRAEISASTLDTVNLRNGCVMIVDDTGMIDGRPVNSLATQLYHEICRPGTVHQVHGDVAIAADEDFA